MPLGWVALIAFASTTVSLTPTDDLWVYPHASDPSKDAYLRVWGTDGKACPANAADATDYSFSFLKWKLDGIPSDKKLIRAQLIVTNIADPGYTPEQATDAPLEAREITPDFTEKTWDYDQLGKHYPKPEKDAIFGTGAPLAWGPAEKVEFRVDLLKGPADFRKALASANASASKELALALTTKLDMSILGRAGIYKLYSKDAETATSRPRLELEFE